MTFPFFPHRSSSDDDVLDQQLNAWVNGDHHRRHSEPAEESSREADLHRHLEQSEESPRGGHQRRHSERSEESPCEALQSAQNLTVDALDFHRWADETRRSDPAAQGPAAGTFDRVLRNSTQATLKGSEEMSSATLTAQSPGFSRVPTEPFRQRSSRYATLAATIALVLAVAVGGWLAMSQMPSGDSDPRFAVIGTPEVADATCDVEPMTVDEVMEIVENPYKYAKPMDYGDPGTGTPSNLTPWYDDYLVVQPMNTGDVSAIYGTVPTQAAMNEALPVLDNFLACAEHATIAHMLRLVDPFSIQQNVVREFPFYRNEQEVRAFVTEWIGTEFGLDRWENEESGAVLTFAPNRSMGEVRSQTIWLGLGFNQILFFGSDVMDSDGNLLARYDAEFSVTEGEQQARFRQYHMVYSMYTQTWYVVMGIWPMAPRI